MRKIFCVIQRPYILNSKIPDSSKVNQMQKKEHQHFGWNSNELEIELLPLGILDSADLILCIVLLYIVVI